MSEEDKKSFDAFEFVAALLLGLGAVGGAWASYQGDLWGGQQQEAYGEAATQATRAAAHYNQGVTRLMRDISLDIEAKKQIVEAVYSKDTATQERALVIASYIYAQQLSDEGYRVTGLPAKYRTKEGRGDERFIPVELIAPTLEKELAADKAYVATMLRDGNDGFAKSEQTFDTGRKANETGDQFGFVSVLYTVALFLAGIALVFKSLIRWGFAALAFGSLTFSTIYLWKTPWAGASAPPAPAASAAGSGAPSPAASGK
ncbi:MAG: hypothetical protein HYZ29_30590 [Myxococcales bacterium]|nr:hypothetical protein [Myxococcales bacterium]